MSEGAKSIPSRRQSLENNFSLENQRLEILSE